MKSNTKSIQQLENRKWKLNSASHQPELTEKFKPELEVCLPCSRKWTEEMKNIVTLAERQ
jgi:hypothetical protein